MIAELHVAAAALVRQPRQRPTGRQHLRQRPITCNEMRRDQSVAAAAATPKEAAELEAAAVIM